eukprot:COSAG01_NODE_16399_length_1239_cov_2.971930_2_plen_117_part_00
MGRDGGVRACRWELALPRTLSKAARARLHEAAEEAGLGHESVGEGAERRLVLLSRYRGGGASSSSDDDDDDDDDDDGSLGEDDDNEDHGADDYLDEYAGTSHDDDDADDDDRVAFS